MKELAALGGGATSFLFSFLVSFSLPPPSPLLSSPLLFFPVLLHDVTFTVKR